jgi:tetratricopeptide (TPR) repeat protein
VSEADAGKPVRSRGRTSPLEATLVPLAEEALARGDLGVAEERFQRLLRQDPDSAVALTGLGRIALARGDRETAATRFREATRADPEAAPAWVLLAESEADDPLAARAHLERAIALEPSSMRAHARLAALTGRAPEPEEDSLDAALRLVERHPYDPGALLWAGKRLAAEGYRDEAIHVLETAVSLADLDVEAADEALATLSDLDAGWSERRIVRVHVRVDEVLRRVPGWRFEQRSLWGGISAALDPVLATRFVVVSQAGFDVAGIGPALEPVLSALGSGPDVPRNGLLAGFTGLPMPRRAGAKRGIADYLGRRLVVRQVPGVDAGRVLAHEILHVYGGIHVVDDLDSLMNASGDSLVIDPLNARIAASLRARTFGPGGVERNVLPRLDRAEAIEAYSDALRVNLTYRKLGIDRLLDDPLVSRYHAAREAQRLATLDPHLGDVSRFVAVLLWEEGRRVEAVALLETASRLYGARSRLGRETLEQADALRALLRYELGVE